MTNHAFTLSSVPATITENLGTYCAATATTGLLRYHNFEQDNWAFNLGGSFPEWQTGYGSFVRAAGAAKFGSNGLATVQGTSTLDRHLVGDVTARPTTYTIRFWVRWKFNSSTSIVEMHHGYLHPLFTLWFTVDRRYAYCRYGTTNVQLDMGESTADTWICFDFIHSVTDNKTRVFRNNAYQGDLAWPVSGAFLGDLNPLGFGLQNNGAGGSYTYLDDLQVYNYDLSAGGATTPVQSAALTATQFAEVADLETIAITGNLTADMSSLSLSAWRRVSGGAETTHGEWEAIADSDTRLTVSYKDSLTAWSSYITVAAFKAIADTETNGFELRVKITPSQADEQIKFDTPLIDYTQSATPTSSPTLTITANGGGIDATVSGSDSGTTNTLYGYKRGTVGFTNYGNRSGDGVINVATLADGLYWFWISSFGPNGTAVSTLVAYKKMTSTINNFRLAEQVRDAINSVTWTPTITAEMLVSEDKALSDFSDALKCYVLPFGSQSQEIEARDRNTWGYTISVIIRKRESVLTTAETEALFDLVTDLMNFLASENFGANVMLVSNSNENSYEPDELNQFTQFTSRITLGFNVYSTRL